MSEQKQNQPWVSGSFLIVLAAIALISIFAGLLLPSSRGPGPARKIRARVEMSNIATAISNYFATYGRLPISGPTNAASDFTFGTFETAASAIGITNASGRQANNSEVMAILLDLTHFEDGRPTPNADHSLNPQRTPFLEIMHVSNTNSPGLGLDGVYRDPWGNPYIITLDLNHDGKCNDAVYGLAVKGPTNVLVWSLGPDKKADSSKGAPEGVNKDNILVWK